MTARIVGILVALAIVGGAVAGSKSSDPDTLARVGEVIGQKTKAAMPDPSKVAGPFTAFRVGDRFPLEEQVRVRLLADKNMAGSQVSVAPGTVAGEVRLRGMVVNSWQQSHAIRLAEETVGVQKVINELAVPE